MFSAIVAAVSLVAGAVAAVSGFGIGSLLTPLLAWKFGTKVAVAAVSVPHLAATALRCWRMRGHVDFKVLRGFGLASAAGGLAGALLHARFGAPRLTLIFGALLVFAGLSGLTGLSKRLHFGGASAWVAGAASGLFGGLVGNQGGIRSAALLGFDVDRQALVATATAIGVIVDAARMPVYLAVEGRAVLPLAPLLAVAVAGAVAGTLLGEGLLRRVPEAYYRRVVSALILSLGAYMLWTGLA
jgi:uncharacterized membrane protein YfcA